MQEKLRKDARELFETALAEADPRKCVLERLELRGNELSVADAVFDLSEFESVYAVAFGKAAPAMAGALEELLGDRITRGLVVSNVESEIPFRRMDFHLSSHPVPDERSVAAAEKAVSLLEKSGKNDLVVFLISGGGSSMLAMPSEGLTLEDKRAVTEKLMLSGADTYGLNTVRKKMSRIKGGGLLEKALPSRVATLILSDVVGDRPEFIASGPTVPDTTTFEDAWRVVEALGLEHRIPPRVVVHLEKGRKNGIPRHMTRERFLESGAVTAVVGSNRKAIASAERAAAEMGYNTLFLSSQISGEAREVAKVLAGICFDVRRFGRPVEKPACILFGGETTVNVQGRGRGGRNTETALSFCFEIIGSGDIVGLFAGTDGIDGPTDAAGAVCDGRSRLVARAMGISARDHLADNDSYTFFEKLGDLVKTGSTGTNVMDIGIVLVGE